MENTKSLPVELWLSIATVSIWIGSAIGMAYSQNAASIAGAATVATLGIWVIGEYADRVKNA